MYIQFQKRAIIITPVYIDFERDTSDKGTQKILICNVDQGHDNVASDEVSAKGSTPIQRCNKKLADHWRREVVQKTKCENFDPFYSLKFDSLILKTHFISL